MMKLGALACVLTLVATAGFAQSPNEPLVDLADIFGTVAADSPAAAPPEGALFTAKPPEKAYCSALAQCDPHPDVSCSTDIDGAICQAVDRNCAAGQPGYVRCHTTYTHCPVCPLCTEGEYRYVETGSCCKYLRLEQREEQCINGRWVATGVYICNVTCA